MPGKKHSSKPHGSKRRVSKRRVSKRRVSKRRVSKRNNKLNGGSPCLIANYSQLLDNNLASQCNNEHKYADFTRYLNQLKTDNQCKLTIEQIAKVKQAVDQCNSKAPNKITGPLQYTPVLINGAYGNKYLYNGRKSSKSKRSSKTKRSRK
jgi:hypothetical protein